MLILYRKKVPVIFSYMKSCRLCHTTKTSKWVLGDLCNKCYHKQYRNEHPEKVRASDKVHGATPNKRFCQIRIRARKKNLSATLTLEEYKALIIQPCYYCNNLLGNPVNYSIGLDRL